MPLMFIHESPMFYFDKGCIKIANAQLEKILRATNFYCAICSIIDSTSGLKCAISEKDGKEFIFYQLTLSFRHMFLNSPPFSYFSRNEEEIEYKNKELALKCNEEIRSFDWESIGVTGFEESVLTYCEEEKIFKEGVQC